jgi:hypothetical protein
LGLDPVNRPHGGGDGPGFARGTRWDRGPANPTGLGGCGDGLGLDDVPGLVES